MVAEPGAKGRGGEGIWELGVQRRSNLQSSYIGRVKSKLDPNYPTNLGQSNGFDI